MIRGLLFVLMMALLLVACAPGSDAPEEPAAPAGAPTESLPPLDDVVIHMERAPCFGTCPVYSVTIHGNGEVVYQGERFVAVTGEQRRQIPEEKVRELLAKIEEVGFFEMKDRYEGEISDLPSTTTTVTIGEREKSVYDYYEPPAGLLELEAKIDEIAGTQEWIQAPNE